MENNPAYQYIEYNKLLLDNTNPRLPKSLHNQPQSAVIEYLLLEASTLEIMQSIGENDFFPGEQLLVTKEDEKYRVLEGNRRLVSVMLLNDFSLAPVKENLVKKVYEEAKYRPKNIPCLIFKSKEEIKKYIGFRHITGMKSWNLTSKARYLSDLKNTYFKNQLFSETCRGLAKMIGSRKDYVERLLIAYGLYEIVENESFYKIRDLDDTTFYIGYLSDCLKKTHIVTFLTINLTGEKPLANLNAKNLKELIHWLYEKNAENKTRVKGRSADLNALNKVLANKTAKQAFIEGEPLYKALEHTQEPDIKFRSSIKKSLEYVELADRIVHKVKEFYIDADDDLDNLRKLAIKIKRTKEDFESGF